MVQNLGIFGGMNIRIGTLIPMCVSETKRGEHGFWQSWRGALWWLARTKLWWSLTEPLAIPWFRRFLSGRYHWNEPCPWQFYIEQSCEQIYHVPDGHGTNVRHVKIKIFLQFLASFQDMIQLDTNCYFISWNVLSASFCGDSSTMTWSGLKSRYSQTKKHSYSNSSIIRVYPMIFQYIPIY